MLRVYLLFVFSLFWLSGACQLTIIINDIPANTPAGSNIFIAGDFQGWNPAHADYQFEKLKSGDYVISIDLKVEQIAFKFTRGDWNSVEGNESGRSLDNRLYKYVAGDTLTLSIKSWEDLSEPDESIISTAADNVKILDKQFYMSALNRHRRVWIYLPPDYQTSGIAYPVLYMHDGQNVFDASTSYTGEWKVDETLNKLHESGDPGIIVVAVDNGQAQRTEEYTPWTNPEYGGGKGRAYVDFLVNELKPHIDTSYRTKPDRDNTGIMGSSLGGHISTYAALLYPKVFGKVGALSPAYWINPEIYSFVEDFDLEEQILIYQIAGTTEGLLYIDNMFEMHEALLQKGFTKENLLTTEHEDGAHSEWYWAREFEDAYMWLFGQ